jgi:tRNA modification GTPase
VPAELRAPAVKAIKALHDEITKVLAAQGHSERLREGLVVAIAGEPNVGKSTLINQLARREVAIVSPHAGTTRDVIEVQLDLDGYPVTLIDTAGIRETDDPVEQEGVRRARARAGDADLVLWLVEGGQAVDLDTMRSRGTPDGVGSSSGSVWIVRNKIDLGEVGPARPGREFRISARQGDGIPELVDALVKFASEFFGTTEGAVVTRARQRELLSRASDSLRRSLNLIEHGEELAAEELRAAAFALGRLLGRVDVEDVLGAVPGSRFERSGHDETPPARNVPIEG